MDANLFVGLVPNRIYPKFYAKVFDVTEGEIISLSKVNTPEDFIDLTNGRWQIFRDDEQIY